MTTPLPLQGDHLLGFWYLSGKRQATD